jgi:hypothetical protein
MKINSATLKSRDTSVMAGIDNRGQFHVEPEPLHEMLQPPPPPPATALPEF